MAASLNLLPRLLQLAVPSIAIGFVLSGCFSTSGRKIAAHIQANQDTSLPSLDDAKDQLVPIDHVAENPTMWWTELDDPVLQKVVETALEKSWEIRLGVTRVAEAQSIIRGARAARMPSLDLNATHLAEDSDVELNEFDGDTLFRNTEVQFDFFWQLDVFGRARASVRGTKERAASSEALLRDVHRLVAAQTVSTYVQLRGVQMRIELSIESEVRRADNLEHIERLLERGYATALDLSRTESQLYQVRATLATLETIRTQRSNQLSLLIGLSLQETRDLLTPGPLSMPPANAPLPSIEKFIFHRPDLRAAEHDLFASAYELNAAKANLYPSLSLGSEIGSAASAIGEWPRLDQLSANIISNLAVPILGRGRLLSAIDLQSARLEAAHLRYEQAIANALAEIDTSLVALSKSREILDQRLLESASARKAAELSNQLFLAGELDYTSVIVAEQTRFSAEDNAIAAQRDALLSYVTYVSAVVPSW